MHFQGSLGDLLWFAPVGVLLLLVWLLPANSRKWSNLLTGRGGWVKDPVCGMEFEEGETAGTLEFNGRKYHFCADGCRKQFEEDPARYVGAQGS